MERKTGLEPATPTLARLCSTTELLPHIVTIIIISLLYHLSSLNFEIVFLTRDVVIKILSHLLYPVNKLFLLFFKSCDVVSQRK